MEFCDLKAQWRAYQPEIEAAIQSVIQQSAFIGGSQVAQLEAELADFCHADHAIACANGTDAIQLVLMALGIGPGDEVLVPDFTFFATAEMVSLVGAKPVFVDIDPVTYQICPKDAQKRISSRTKALIAVSLFGQLPEIPALKALAAEHNLYLIEDAAQSFGAQWNSVHPHEPSTGRSRVDQKPQDSSLTESKTLFYSGSWAPIATTSFFPAKPLGCYGDGGAVFCQNPQLAQRIRLLANHGSHKRYLHEAIGLNSRLDGIQAAVLRVKLGHFAQELQQRQAIAEHYHELLRAHCPQVRLPELSAGHASAWAQYTIALPAGLSEHRSEIQERMAQEGIPTAVHYPIPLHKQPIYLDLGIQNADSDYPHATAAAQSVLSLPMSAFVKAPDQEHIARTLGMILKKWDSEPKPSPSSSEEAK